MSSFDSQDELLLPVEAAQFRKVSTHTLAVWRSAGGGPIPFVRVGSRVRYRRSDVLNYLKGTQGGRT